jgi:type IV pilus assembly protein PilA
MRALTPTEAALAVAIGGSVLFAALPAFVNNLHASRLAEPIDGVGAIAARATALAASQTPETAYPPSVALTPALVPRAERVVDVPGSWDHPTWKQLGFAQTVPHCFSFAFDSRNGKGLATFRAVAHGDLDGDGIHSTFAIAGEFREGSQPRTLPLEIEREIE